MGVSLILVTNLYLYAVEGLTNREALVDLDVGQSYFGDERRCHL